MKRRLLRWSAVITMTVMLCTVFAYRPAPAAANSLGTMQNELEDISKKKEKLEKELAAIEDKIDSEYETKDLLDRQINELQQEVKVLNGVLETTEAQLAEKQQVLTEKQVELAEKKRLAKQRIRADYEAGPTSYLEILLNAENLFDFISRAEIASQIAAYDKKVIAELSETEAVLRDAKDQIEQNRDAQQKAKDKLTSSQKSLKAKQNRSNQIIDKLNKDEKANLAAYEAAEKAEAELQAEIKRELTARGESEVEYTEGEWGWPLKGYYTITSKFGMRTHPKTGVYKLHTGCDIAGSGVRGKPILAAKSGEVIKAGYNSAYGNYVMVDHGGGYVTLYAHATSLAVGVKEYVTKGQTIAYVGSTGYSTGPHLHFEIIVNGEYKNPLGFYPKLSFTYA